MYCKRSAVEFKAIEPTRPPTSSHYKTSKIIDMYVREWAKLIGHDIGFYSLMESDRDQEAKVHNDLLVEATFMPIEMF